jgi:uncharacterized ferredoxin-like protein
MSMALEPEVRSKVLRDTAEKMMTAARTAPKARGIDNLVISAAYGDTIKLIAEKMKELVKEGKGPDYFVRDADNILSAEIVVLLGTRIDPLGIKFCGYCGHKNCAEKNNHPDQPCALNTNDLGIAIGSAVSVAMDERVDNRIMHSIGVAVRELGLLDKDVRIIYGIPLSIGAKNPFFDRK